MKAVFGHLTNVIYRAFNVSPIPTRCHIISISLWHIGIHFLRSVLLRPRILLPLLRFRAGIRPRPWWSGIRHRTHRTAIGSWTLGAGIRCGTRLAVITGVISLLGVRPTGIALCRLGLVRVTTLAHLVAMGTSWQWLLLWRCLAYMFLQRRWRAYLRLRSRTVAIAAGEHGWLWFLVAMATRLWGRAHGWWSSWAVGVSRMKLWRCRFAGDGLGCWLSNLWCIRPEKRQKI
jgi:hypothetical protein